MCCIKYSLLAMICLIRDIIVAIETDRFEVRYYKTMYNQFNEKYLQSITDEHKTVCLDKIDEEITKTSFSQIVKYSGKSFSDQGYHKQCNAINHTYFLYIYNKTVNDDEYVLKFIRKKVHFYGLCIYNECYELFSNETARQLIRALISDEKSKIDIYPVLPKSFHPKANENESNESSMPNGYYAIIIACILLLFLLIKLLAWFFTMACEDDRRVIKYGLELATPDSLNDSYEPDSLLIQPEKPLPLFSQNQSKEQKEKAQLEEQRIDLKTKVIAFLNIKENLKQLIDLKNQFYDDTNIELLSFIRMMTLFFMVYNHNFYCLVHLPVKHVNEKDFYLNAKMMLLKMSTFSSNSWIVIEGFILAFKFMSFAKKIMIKIDSSFLPIKYLFFFYCKSLSKIVSFIVIFLLVSLGIDQISIFGLPPMFNYFIKYLNVRQCTTKPASMFNPFSLLYFDYMNQLFGFTNCFKYVCICFNTHLCFIFVLILLNVSMRLKSKIFDLIILILFILNIGLIKISSHFDYHREDTKYFSINYLYGETYSMKYSHLFINYYFVGVIGGMMHFYYFDVISRNPFHELNGNYNPFFFCFFLMKSFDSLNHIIKKIIEVICILIMGFISFAYWLFYDKTIDNPIFYPITPLYQFIDMYEKIIFVVALMTMVLLILFNRNVSSFKAFYSNRLFRLIARISFPIFCSMDNIIYLFYSIYYIIIVLNFNNTFFLSIGLILLLMVINSMIIFTVDFPIKVITCYITNREKPKTKAKAKKEDRDD